MNGQPKPRVLVVGDAAHGDFARVRLQLRANSEVWFVRDCVQAAAWLDGNRPIDWVVLVQSRPGQLPRDTVGRLRPLAGQAGFVSILGSWCEGELRTGRPWPDVPRCYWYAFSSWWRSGATGSAQALNSSRGTGRASGAQGGFVAVSTVDYATAETLLDALATEGCSGVWWPRHGALPVTRGILTGIWVGGQLHGREALQLDAFCRTMRSQQAPVLALLDFPRRDRVELARRIGAAEVLGKPWLLPEVAHTLRRLQETNRSVTDNRNLAIQSA